MLMDARAILTADDALALPASRNAFARAFAALERRFDDAFGAAANPLRQLGALGFYFFWIVAASGIYVYAFFDTSVLGAYRSLESLAQNQRYLGGVMRSLHRYASDALVVVMVLHLLRELAYGRFRGFRWFPWVSGVPLIWLAFASGIGGYWLIWDELAQFIGLATTEWFGALPGFDVSMVRNFLVADTLSDRFFSLLVFLHIGIPLFLLLGMWIHIQRVTRAKSQPDRTLGWATLGTLVLLSLAKPALSQPPAHLGSEPLALQFDWLYLFAYPWVYRLSPQAVWYALAAIALGLCAAPWMVRRERSPVAQVDAEFCNGCGRCFADCPYSAVIMQPRKDASDPKKIAVVLGDLCASCGLCAGACPSSTPFRATESLRTGMDMPQLRMSEMRRRMEDGIDALAGEAKLVVFGCEHGVHTRALQGPSVARLGVPCVGMVPPSFIEYALRAGADGVMLIGCAEGDCEYRLGTEWTRRRLDGTREPHLRATVPRGRVCLIQPYAHESGAVARELHDFRTRIGSIGEAARSLPRPKRRTAIHG